MKWLVTGSAGFIGSRLMETIDNPIGCDIANSKEPHDDVNQRAWAPVERIAHLAAVSGIKDCASQPAAAFANNVLSMHNVLWNAWVTNEKVVFTSSAAAANPESSIYAATKASAEHLCQAYRKEYGLHVSILRLGNVYGPGSIDKNSCVAAFCKQAIKDGRIIVEGTGHQTRHFVYVGDVIKAIHQMPDGLHAVHAYEQYEVGAVAEMIASLSGADIYHVPARPNDTSQSSDITQPLAMDYVALWTGIQETWEYFKETMK